jgi:phage-related tail fiber protein
MVIIGFYCSLGVGEVSGWGIGAVSITDRGAISGAGGGVSVVAASVPEVLLLAGVEASGSGVGAGGSLTEEAGSGVVVSGGVEPVGSDVGAISVGPMLGVSLAGAGFSVSTLLVPDVSLEGGMAGVSSEDGVGVGVCPPKIAEALTSQVPETVWSWPPLM